MSHKSRFAVLLVAGLSITSSCGNGKTSDPFGKDNFVDTSPRNTGPTTTLPRSPKTISEYLATNPDYSIFWGLVKKSGADKQFRSGRFLTVLAPSNVVFSVLPASTTKELDDNPTALKRTVLNHMILADAMSDDFIQGRVNAVSGQELKLGVDAKITVNGLKLVDMDRRFKDGIVHGIAGVILG